MARNKSKSRAVWQGKIVRRAILDSFVKLDPRHMMGNPVMFVVEVGSVLTTVLLRRDPTPPDGQVVDEKRQRDLIQLVGDELIGELAGKRHQVVGRDRTCDRYAHGGYPAWCQWKESPQAQEPVAFGLSMVKPCFSIVSTKSMVAPIRYGALILSVTTWTPLKSLTMSPSMSRSSK